MESHKRPFSEMNAAAPATAAAAASSSSSDATLNDAAQTARDQLMHERRLLESQLKHAAASLSSSGWSSAAATFAAQHLSEATAVRDFRLLCDVVQKGSGAAVAESSAGEERKETAAPTLPTMQTAPSVAIKPPILPVMVPAAPPAASSSSSVAAAASPAASPASSPAAASPSAAVAAGSDPVDLLVSYSDISLLVPRGKYTLHLSSSGALFAQPPGPKSQSHSFRWSDVSAVIDVADVFKRDWYVVLTLHKSAKGIVVGKQTHYAVVIKMQATEKMKEGRAKTATGTTAAKDPAARAAIARIQSLIDAQMSAHPAATLSSSLVASLREIPALAGVPFVAHDPSIFSSQKQLPCVSCKLGVEDGALYFLRTGLLFIKPVLYLPLSELDGITPARGPAGTFDMKVGTVGSQRETAFGMIEPKEEGAITKYCGFLGAEQKRIEKAERREKQAAVDAAAGIVKAEPAAAAASSSSSAAAAAPSASSSSSAPAPHSGASASDAIALDDDEMSDARPAAPPSAELVASLLSSAGLSTSDIIHTEPGKRPQRKAKPTSFEGMDSDDDNKPAAAAAAGSSASAKPAAPAAAAAAGKPADAGSDPDEDDADDAESVPSSEEDDYSAGSGSESSDSAEYDSDKDAEEIASDAEGKSSGHKGAMAASSAEEESEEEEAEAEEEEADSGMQDA